MKDDYDNIDDENLPAQCHGFAATTKKKGRKNK